MAVPTGLLKPCGAHTLHSRQPYPTTPNLSTSALIPAYPNPSVQNDRGSHPYGVPSGTKHCAQCSTLSRHPTTLRGGDVTPHTEQKRHPGLDPPTPALQGLPLTAHLLPGGGCPHPGLGLSQPRQAKPPRTCARVTTARVAGPAGASRDSLELTDLLTLW